jgi:hypothetical protein
LSCNCKPLPRALSFWERFTNRAGPHPLAALPAPTENLNDAIRNTVAAIGSTHDKMLRAKLGHHLDALLTAQARELTQ